jgi:MFS family permease
MGCDAQRRPHGRPGDIRRATIAPTYTNIYSTVDGLVPRGTATEAFSWLESAVTGGSAAGSALAGVLTQHFSADRAFLAAAAFGVVAVVAALTPTGTIRLPADTRPSAFGAARAEASAPTFS